MLTVNEFIQKYRPWTLSLITYTNGRYVKTQFSALNKDCIDDLKVFLNKVDEKGWIPQNVEINAFFKPTLSKETLPFLQTKEEILNYYKFFDTVSTIIMRKTNSNFNFNQTLYQLKNFLAMYEFRKKYVNEKLICKVKLCKFYMIQNLMDKGEIQKKILRRSPDRKFNYARNGDIVRYTLKCTYKDKEIFNKVNQTSELDKELDKTIYEIEHRILENVKIGEYSVITVNPS